MKAFRHLVVCLPLLVLLTGCTGQDPTPQVASLPSTATSSGTVSSSAGASTTDTAASGTAVNDRRPQLQLDTPDSEVARLGNRWRQCLLDHGARGRAQATDRDMSSTVSKHEIGIVVVQPYPAKAVAACVSVEPREPKELYAATNPRFHEQSLQWIACMRDKGLWYNLVNDQNLTATFTPGHAVPDDVEQIEDTCKLQVFGGRH